MSGAEWGVWAVEKGTTQRSHEGVVSQKGCIEWNYMQRFGARSLWKGFIAGLRAPRVEYFCYFTGSDGAVEPPTSA